VKDDGSHIADLASLKYCFVKAARGGCGYARYMSRSLAAVVLCWLGCSSTTPVITPEPTPPLPATTQPTPANEEPPPKGEGRDDVKTMFVDAKLVDCVGEGPMKCMRIRDSADGEWTLLYDSIEGFEHEEGNLYELKVEVQGVSDSPADASSLRYRLVEVVSKEETK